MRCLMVRHILEIIKERHMEKESDKEKTCQQKKSTKARDKIV